MASFPGYKFIKGIYSALIFLLAFLILKPFVQPIAWAIVLVICLWPVHSILKSKLAKSSDILAASLSTFFLMFLILGILIPVSIGATGEAKRFIQTTRELLESETLFDSVVDNFPLSRSSLELVFPGDTRPGESALRMLNEHQATILSAVSVAARGAGQFLFSIGVMLFTCFCLFRFGEVLSKQAVSVAGYLGGKDYQEALHLAWNTIGAVLYGVVVAAFMQGVLAGIGFYIFGAPLPLLFGFVTIILGFIPFGPPLLYIPMAVYLLYSSASLYSGLGLAIWGVAFISTADNIFRPIFVSRATNLPVLLAFFGGLGGIISFGMIGLFIGPIFFALFLQLWKRLVTEAELTALK